ncbi:acyltransferase, partial [Liquorilactobacillus satsumensis]|uniref:acyltransferase n=1 Tax=Liquorilactobacillus satsumensis TaxID=259059 RepID=UPI0039E8C568
MFDNNWIEPKVKTDNLTVGKRDWIRNFTYLKNVLISDDVFIGYSCNIKNALIDSFVQIAGKTTISGDDEAVVHISSFAWIGADVYIAAGIDIGQGAVIGAGAVVTKDVSPFQIVVGNPAHFLKRRNIKSKSKPEFFRFMNFIKMHPQEPKISALNLTYESHTYVQSDVDLKGNLYVGQNTIMDGKYRKNKCAGGIRGIGNIEIGSNCLLEVAGGL